MKTAYIIEHKTSAKYFDEHGNEIVNPTDVQKYICSLDNRCDYREWDEIKGTIKYKTQKSLLLLFPVECEKLGLNPNIHNLKL